MLGLHLTTGLRNPFPVIAVIAGTCGAAFLALVAVFVPIVAVAPLILLLLGALLINDRLRMAFVVFGGLLTLQTSQDITPIKGLYLAGVVIALVGSISQVAGSQTKANLRLLLPLLAGSLIFVLVITGSFFVAVAHGTDPTAWLRDSAPYFLFAAVPIFALDVSRSPHTASLVAMFILAGMLSTVSFTVSWLDRRHVADLAFNRLVLPSLLLPSAMWSYAVARIVQGKGNQIGWIAIVLLVPALVFVTGARSGLVLLAAPVGIILAFKGSFITSSLRLLLLTVAASLTAIFLVWSVGRLTAPENQIVASRFASLAQVLVTPERDQSYLERVSEVGAAWNTFVGDPFLGTGPGHAFIWQSSGFTVSSFNIDNVLSFPAKFGAIGLAVLLLIVLGYASFVRRLSIYGAETGKLALVGYLAIVLAYLPLASPFEDKGFSFALLFLLILGLDQGSLNRSRPVRSFGTTDGGAILQPARLESGSSTLTSAN